MIAASLIATALYLLPVVALVMARWSREQPLSQLAVHIPCGVASDLLVISLLARWVQLDVAIVSSRVGWALAAGWFAFRRIRGRAGPMGLSSGALVVLATAASLALALSAWLSRRYVIWDRDWHIPLVTSLRGQSIPFANVFQPQLHLGYHVSGDVLAGTLQALSGARLHSSAALSLAHDLMFMLTALCISSLLFKRDQGPGWLSFSAVAPLAVLLAGLPNAGHRYSFFHFYQMSYRPHVVLAGLLIVGITASALQIFQPAPAPPARAQLWPLLVMNALLAITDEPSAFMVIPTLGLVALLERRRLPGRFAWLVIGGAMAAATLASVALLPSTLRGGPRLPTRFVSPRISSFYAPTLPLTSIDGLRTLLIDVAPMLSFVLVLGLLALIRRRREHLSLLAFGGAVFGMGTFFLTCLVVADTQPESHRFMTLPQVVLPLLVLFIVDQVSRLARVGIAILLLASAACSVLWAVGMEPELRRKYQSESFSAGMEQIDCRQATGARLFEQPRPTYVPQREWYLWTGCHPVLAPGGQAGQGNTMDVAGPIFDKRALDALWRRFVPRGEALQVACPVDERNDSVCRRAAAGGRCVQMGSGWNACALARPAKVP
jgi:hypothetical protein